MRYLVILISTLLLVSCAEKSNVFSGKQSLVQRFPAETTLRGDVFLSDEYGILDMSVVGDYFVLTSVKREHVFYVYDKENKLVGEFGSIGRGPNELLNCRYTGQSDASGLWINDVSQSKLLHFDIAQSLEIDGVIFDKVMPTLPYSVNCFYVADSTLYVEQMLPDNFEMKKTNSSVSEVLYTPSIPAPFSIYKSVWRKQPSGGKLAGAMLSLNQLNIFEPGKNDRKSLIIGDKPTRIDTAVDKETGLEVRTYYCDLCVTATKIYALWMDQPYDDAFEAAQQQQVHVFDWDGKPLRKFLLPEYIIKIAVDESQNCIYGKSADDIIYKYEMGGAE